MSRFLTFWILTFSLAACHDQSTGEKRVDKVISEVKEKYVTDSREAIFKVTIKDNILKGETTSPGAKEELIARLRDISVEFIDSLLLLPDSTVGSKCWGLVNISVCNIRYAPGQDAEMATQAILGTPVKILKNVKGWYLIQTPDSYIGWVDNGAIIFNDLQGLNGWKTSQRVVYQPIFGMGYTPGSKDVVTDLVAGSILQVEDENKSMWLLSMPDGRKLEIPKEEGLDFDRWKSQPESTPDQIIAYAKTMMGFPYLWGGTSSKGIDCSGFVKTVYFRHGIILARDASLQFKYGNKVVPEQGYQSMQKGDLTFFGKKKDGQPKATHVGMYIGDGEFIHSSGMVGINSFDSTKVNFSSSRAKSWLGGRRVIGSQNTDGIVRVADHPWYSMNR